MNTNTNLHCPEKGGKIKTKQTTLKQYNNKTASAITTESTITNKMREKKKGQWKIIWKLTFPPSLIFSLFWKIFFFITIITNSNSLLLVFFFICCYLFIHRETLSSGFIGTFKLANKHICRQANRVYTRNYKIVKFNGANLSERSTFSSRLLLYLRTLLRD